MEFSYIDTRTPEGWKEWTLINADIENGGVVLATELAPATVIGDIQAVDIAVDDCQDLHVLDSAGGVHRYDRNAESFQLLPWTGDDGGVEEPRALWVTADTIYVADGSDGRVRAYAKRSLELQWTSEESYDDPVGIVHDGRHVSVLARGSGPGDGHLAMLDDAGAVGLVVSGLVSPRDIAIDGAGNRYVLDVEGRAGTGEPTAVVRRFPAPGPDLDRIEATDVPDGGVKEFPAGTSCIEAIDVRHVLAAVGSNDSGGSVLYHAIFPDSDPERMVRVEHGCSRLIAKPDRTNGGIEGLYAIDEGASEVYFLEEGGRTRRNGRTSLYDAQAIDRLDSGERGTQWHRTTLELDLVGRDTQVRLSYSATDDDELVADSRDLRRIDGVGVGYAEQLREADITWISELASLGPEEVAERVGVASTRAEPWVERARELLVDWNEVGEPNPRDALLESAEGRFLWVKIELIGSESASPRVGSFRVYFPRRSYLRYLPGIYRRDEASEAFLERFLSIFESVFVDVEEEIESVTRYLDPGGIPAGDLPWLGRWMALETDEAWPERATRELVSRAPELFKKRGTREGLLAHLRIFLRHVVPQTAWREALDIDGDAVMELVKEGAVTEREVAETLGNHASLRTISGDRRFRHMIVAWSEAWERHQRTLDRMENAGHLAEDEADAERETVEDLIRESDEGSLRYVLAYARVLTELAEPTERDRVPVAELIGERERYGGLIRDSGRRDVPYLIESPDLDCIDSEAVREAYDGLVGHERGFVVLVRPFVTAEEMRAIQRIVDSERPAHADGRAVELKPRIKLGANSYLGMNSVLSKHELVLERSGLGADSMLEERADDAQLGVGSTFNGDTLIP